MQREFRLKPANLVAFQSSVFESRRISFLKIFLVKTHQGLSIRSFGRRGEVVKLDKLFPYFVDNLDNFSRLVTGSYMKQCHIMYANVKCNGFFFFFGGMCLVN